MRSLRVVFSGVGLSILVLALTACQTLPGVRKAQEPEAWTFVSFPDFFNFDVPNPSPKWDDAIDWFLRQLKAENPRFSLVAGDLVNGHWWDSPEQLEHLGNVYYGGWMRRLRDHDLLPVYTAVGDHELGDDPWPPEKITLIPEFRRAFTAHMDHPLNGPKGYAERAYWVREGNLLVLTLETFQVRAGEMAITVTDEQLAWADQVLREHADATFRIVQAHVPILPGARKRSSSGLELEGAQHSALWQMMVRHGVDLYFCGEHHDITCREHQGVWQVVHGASWGRVPTVNYLKGTVQGDTLHVELKEIPLSLDGGAIWNINKDPGPREIVRIPQATRDQGFQTVGTLTIDKTGGGKRFTEATGYFAEPFAALAE